MEGRLVVTPTVYQQCEIALACMHPEFKEKYVLAVAARAAQSKRVKMYEGVLVVTEFRKMQALMREAQVFWDDDAEKCGRITHKRDSQFPGIGYTMDWEVGANIVPHGTRLCRCCGSKEHSTLTCPDKRALATVLLKLDSVALGMSAGTCTYPGSNLLDSR